MTRKKPDYNKISLNINNLVKMVLYDNLPVYKDSYDLLIQTFEAVKKFEK